MATLMVSFAALAFLILLVQRLGVAWALRCGASGWRALLGVPVKDALVFITWFHGLWARTVVWRGNRLRVGQGSRLLRPAHELTPAHSEAA